ncbi:MAG: hypothetical protein WC818_10735 [Pseudomonas sp.]|jgi:hypothetical protein|uniref:hypothetical protein n=1 Tax=Pseudomonas sp. TaxID=306 RepID=UPI003564A629
MVQLVVFRNVDGHLGFIQRDGNDISYYVNTPVALYSISGANSWQTWVQYIDAGHGGNADREIIGKEAIKYFLHGYQETISTDIVEMEDVQRPGSFYPRVSRENIFFNYVSEQFLQDVRAYQNIQYSLDGLFNYIEPSASNLSAYGHKIRELLILACTEVECLLVKTLVDNGYEQKDRYSTSDYIKCKDILGLDKFEVTLVQYPSVKVFKPFRDWKAESPTKSLPWYNAYNAVKHNRSDNITDANLEHLLDAISGIHILLESQYGKGIFERWNSQTEDRSVYKTVARPQWNCTEITAPILIAGYSIDAKWTEQRKYFEDYKI